MELELGIVKFIELTIDLTEKILINVELMREEKSWKKKHWQMLVTGIQIKWRQKMFEELTIENWNDCMDDEVW